MSILGKPWRQSANHGSTITGRNRDGATTSWCGSVLLSNTRLPCCLNKIGHEGIIPHGVFGYLSMSRKITVESLSHIDINELNRLGAFARPMEFPFLGLRTSLRLIEYRGPKWPTDRPSQRIPIQWTHCNYGGSRPWLTCLCGRRVGKLYRGSAWLGCRQCAEATYESQRKSQRGRLFRKATRIRARLGDYGRPGIDTFPPRPFGMQRKIYNRLKTKAEIIERKLIQGSIYRPRLRRKLSDYARRA